MKLLYFWHACMHIVAILIGSSFSVNSHLRSLFDSKLNQAHVCHSLDITCWSSCSFMKNCWGEGYKNSYIYCEWFSQLRNTTYVASVMDTKRPHIHCVLNVICASTSKSFICHTYAFVNVSSCKFIAKENIKLQLTIKTINTDKSECSKVIGFNPCNIVKLDPPIANAVNYSNKVYVELQKPECTEGSWKPIVYNVTYTVFDGLKESPPNTKVILDEVGFCYLPLFNARRYTIYVKAAVADIPHVLRIWSKPSQKSFVTRPRFATDHSVLDAECFSKGNKTRILLKWQKRGFIQKFTVSVNDVLGYGEEKQSVIDYNFDDHYQFHAEFYNLSKTAHYNISLVAENSSGLSHPTMMLLNTSMCNYKQKQPTKCHTESRGEHWINSEWVLPQNEPSYDAFQITISGFNDIIVTKRISKMSTSYNITGLKACVFYTQVIQSMLGEMKVASCTVESYTLGNRFSSTPDFDIINVKENSLSVVISDMLLNESCQVITVYEIVCKSNDDKHTFYTKSKILTITGLIPYTTYTVTVFGKTSMGYVTTLNSKQATTMTSAPSAPTFLPVVDLGNGIYFVHWRKPLEPNGEISNYTVAIINKKQRISLPQNMDCQISNDSTFCYFGPTEQNMTIMLPFGTELHIQACTDQGKKCSEWSNSIKILRQYFLKYSTLLIIAGLVLAFVLLLSAYIFIGRQKSEPVIHKDIEKSLHQFPGCNYYKRSTRGTGLFSSYSRHCIKLNEEICDSLTDWRNSSLNSYNFQHSGICIELQNMGNESTICTNPNEDVFLESFLIDVVK
ncbi:uncharacterized protein LOC143461634 isoform X1 [Clavelina lepadiformis]|uniref:uncharacterized protein LOC143461634 isoform X1 n=1 Tax=Clavelina lepadiformis TaxID=159417 RepID=UPI004043160F